MRRALLAMLVFAVPAAAAPERLAPGSPVPEIVRTDFAGKPFDLANYRGKIILIDFWASWCAPCLVEMPHLIAMQKRLGPEGLQVIGISMDDSAAAAEAATKHFAFNYPVLPGDAKLGSRFGGIFGLPVEMLVSRNGRMVKIWTGDIPAGEVERAVREAALKSRT